MSRPTMRLRSERLGILACLIAGAMRAVAAPADRKTVAVAHVDIGNVIGALRDELDRGRHEALEALIDLAVAQAHGDAVRQIKLPGAAFIEPQRRQMQARLDEASLGCQVARGNQRLGALRPREPREL